MQLPKIVVPIITPFDKEGCVYEEGVRNLIAFLNEKGIKSLWILGSYGSFPLMTDKERMKMAEISVSLAHEYGMTAIVQIGSASAEKALLLANHAEKAGADGLASVVPFYYASAHYREKNFLDYFQMIINATSLPLFYYNNPKTTGYSPSISFVKKLLELGVVGIKDTVSDFLSIVEKIRLFEEIKPEGFYLGGSSSVYYPACAMGAKGIVCGTAVALPELILKLDEAVAKQDRLEAQRLQKIVHRVREIQGRYVGRSVACYDILAARGVDVGTVKSPWKRMTEHQVNEIVSELKALPEVLPE